MEFLDKIRKRLHFLAESLWIAMGRQDSVQHGETPDYNDDNKTLTYIKRFKKRE